MIICLLIPLSTVSASDINNTADNQVLSATPNVDTISANVNNGENNNDTLSVNDENVLSAGPQSGNNILGDFPAGTYKDLNKLIILSTDVLQLYQNYTYAGSTDDDVITISKSITIEGNGYTINGNFLKTAFYVTANNVTIRKLLNK